MMGLPSLRSELRAGHFSRQDEVLPELYFQRRRSVRWRCVPWDLTGAETGSQRSSRSDRCVKELLDASGREQIHKGSKDAKRNNDQEDQADIDQEWIKERPKEPKDLGR